MISELADGMVVGGALSAVSFLVGRATGRRAGPQPPKAPEAVCGCEHPLAVHDPQTNRCHGTDRKQQWNKSGAYIGYHDIPCTCRQYTGPRPIDTVFAPRLLPPEGS